MISLFNKCEMSFSESSWSAISYHLSYREAQSLFLLENTNRSLDFQDFCQIDKFINVGGLLEQTYRMLV